MGVMACKKEALQLELARHKNLTDQLSSVRYLHVLRHYNAAADSLATEAFESKMVGSARTLAYTSKKPIRRIQGLKDSNSSRPEFLNGSAELKIKQKLKSVRAESLTRRILTRRCHNSIEGGHQGVVRTFYRVKDEFYWVGLYAGVSKHVQTCEDCSTSKSKPQLRGYSPVNVTSEYPFQMVSMDSVIPLPVTRRGNTALLLFQDHFTGFVITKAMSETGALEVAKAFEECVFRRFGAPSLILHDRDPRFMSEVFQAFAELMQSRSRVTLSYRPQANGQQERSVKTMIQTVRAYVEDPLQTDWDDIAEKWCMQSTTRETRLGEKHRFTLCTAGMPSRP
ncbi:unnamed protein product [Phytophthora fragariaefolia]|uniref:Unnamed protein product n=1 Tax=Phytophthora fragariaefolia TaxID=1490495 RepID=A0A9W6YDG9_9STRA|nr:unnamed protein product [Phytophthora fragariaefolia]